MKGTQGFSFSFTAQREDEGPPTKENVAAKGQFEYHPEAEKTQMRVHGEVLCLSVIKNMALIGGVITQSNSKEKGVGEHVIFSATDNGEGDSNPKDMLSQLIPTADGKKACADPFKVPIGPTIKDGNIQVPWVK